jgi:hypothetical protein
MSRSRQQVRLRTSPEGGRPKVWQRLAAATWFVSWLILSGFLLWNAGWESAGLLGETATRDELRKAALLDFLGFLCLTFAFLGVWLQSEAPSMARSGSCVLDPRMRYCSVADELMEGGDRAFQGP